MHIVVGNEQSSPLPTGLTVRAEQKPFHRLSAVSTARPHTSIHLVTEVKAELLQEVHYHKGHHNPLALFKYVSVFISIIWFFKPLLFAAVVTEGLKHSTCSTQQGFVSKCALFSQTSTTTEVVLEIHSKEVSSMQKAT